MNAQMVVFVHSDSACQLWIREMSVPSTARGNGGMGWLLIVIVDHSHPFPTFSTRKKKSFKIQVGSFSFRLAVTPCYIRPGWIEKWIHRSCTWDIPWSVILSKNGIPPPDLIKSPSKIWDVLYISVTPPSTQIRCCFQSKMTQK